MPRAPSVAAEKLQFQEAIRAVTAKDRKPLDHSTYDGVIRTCLKQNACSEAKLLQTHMTKFGFKPQTRQQNMLLTLYSKFQDSLREACNLFDKMAHRDVVSWTVMISAFARHGMESKSLFLFNEMQTSGTRPNQFSFSSILSACGRLSAVVAGRCVHASVIRSGFNRDIVVGNALLDMYAKCRDVDSAVTLFDEMPERNTVSWNALIAGYVQNGLLDEASLLFQQMPEPNCVAWTSIIAGIAQNGRIAEALEMFHGLQDKDVRSWNAILSGLVQNGCQEAALVLSRSMFYQQMIPNGHTLDILIRASADLGNLSYGQEIHSYLLRSWPSGLLSDVVLGNGLIDMYSRCGQLQKSRKVFDSMTQRNSVSWALMIHAYSENGSLDEALKLFQKIPKHDVASWNAMIPGFEQNGMQKLGFGLNSQTCVIVLTVCTKLGFLKKGMEIHALVIRKALPNNVCLGSALIDMYSKCGSIKYATYVFDRMVERDTVVWNSMIAGYVHNGCLDMALTTFQKIPEKAVSSWNTLLAGFAKHDYLEHAEDLFNKMPQQDLVSWNTLISGYAQNGHFREALETFIQMQKKGEVQPNEDTMAALISTCRSLSHGKILHGDVLKQGFSADLFVGSSLVNMYSKCGSITDAHSTFTEIYRPDLASWNAMIAGYAMHSNGREALQLFEGMQQSGIVPDAVTFVALLSACCHSGLVEEAKKCFEIMVERYQIKPSMEHYGCMVDVLGRAGCLGEAEIFIKRMPIRPDMALWASLLNSCKVHHDVEMAERVALHMSNLRSTFAKPSENSLY